MKCTVSGAEIVNVPLQNRVLWRTTLLRQFPDAVALGMIQMGHK